MRPRLQPQIFAPRYAHFTPTQWLAHMRERRQVRTFPITDETQTSAALSELVLQNQFVFNEERYQLPREFDWTVNPSADVEWLILLHKFYFAAGLGAAYETTCDARYAAKWMELTERWLATVPLDFMPSDVAGRRIQNWLSAHHYFVAAAPETVVTPEFYARFLHSLHQQVAHLVTHLTPARNHRTLELWAIFFAAVTFPEFAEAAAWLRFSVAELTANAQSDLLADGVHCELSSDYHCLVLRNFLYVIRLAQLNGITLPASLHQQVRKALEFALYLHKPDGLIPALSDGDTGSYLALLAQGAKLYGDEALRYGATRGARGTAPAERSRHFAQGGYTFLRSGWGERESYEDERYLVFDCGPLGAGNHGHLDVLSFEMAAYGQSLIVDPGRYTYHEPQAPTVTNWRVHFRGTGAHNTVRVNGCQQTRYEFHRRKFKITGEHAAPALHAFISLHDFDYAHGSAHSHEYEAVHERKIIFVAGEYWLITDVLRASTPHDYELFFHLSDSAHERTTLQAAPTITVLDAPHLVMAQVAQPDAQTELRSDFVSPRYGVKHAAPVLRVAQRAADTSFHTVLYPYKDQRPEITVEQFPVQTDTRVCERGEASALVVTVTNGHASYKDYFLLKQTNDNETYAAGPLRYDGALLHVRTDSAGRLLQRHVL